MKANAFRDLLRGVREAGEFARGERLPARIRVMGGNTVRDVREVLRFGQAEFARLLGVRVRTLRGWERERREPRGPAGALLRAIQNDPPNVLRALKTVWISVRRQYICEPTIYVCCGIFVPCRE